MKPDTSTSERPMSQRSAKTKPRYQRLKLAQVRQRASQRLDQEATRFPTKAK